MADTPSWDQFVRRVKDALGPEREAIFMEWLHRLGLRENDPEAVWVFIVSSFFGDLREFREWFETGLAQRRQLDEDFFKGLDAFRDDIKRDIRQTNSEAIVTALDDMDGEIRAMAREVMQGELSSIQMLRSAAIRDEVASMANAAKEAFSGGAAGANAAASGDAVSGPGRLAVTAVELAVLVLMGVLVGGGLLWLVLHVRHVA